jgi:acetyl-CoA carboxylase biotin carboxyl carrier protein
LDIKEIKQIVDLMKRSGLTEFEIEEKEFKLRICRKNGENPNFLTSPSTMPPFPMGGHQMPIPPAPEVAPIVEEGRLIKSPMVGTYYEAPNPESGAFVSVGSSLSEESIVCIIEAMKVMNEIKAEMTGKITEVLVQNGDSVEYGQPLFRVK